MIIIVDGVDRAGKTTTINALQNLTGFPVVKHSKESDDEVLSLLCSTINRERMIKRNVIFDRFYWPSDLAYNPVVEQRPSAIEPHSFSIQSHLKDLNTVVVYVTANSETIKKRYEDLGPDWYLTLNKVTKIQMGYTAVLMNSILPVIIVDTDKMTPEEAAEYILSCNVFRVLVGKE